MLFLLRRVDGRGFLPLLVVPWKHTVDQNPQPLNDNIARGLRIMVRRPMCMLGTDWTPDELENYARALLWLHLILEAFEESQRRADRENEWQGPLPDDD